MKKKYLNQNVTGNNSDEQNDVDLFIESILAEPTRTATFDEVSEEVIEKGLIVEEPQEGSLGWQVDYNQNIGIDFTLAVLNPALIPDPIFHQPIVNKPKKKNLYQFDFVQAETLEPIREGVQVYRVVPPQGKAIYYAISVVNGRNLYIKLLTGKSVPKAVLKFEDDHTLLTGKEKHRTYWDEVKQVAMCNGRKVVRKHSYRETLTQEEFENKYFQNKTTQLAVKEKVNRRSKNQDLTENTNGIFSAICNNLNTIAAYNNIKLPELNLTTDASDEEFYSSGEEKEKLPWRLYDYHYFHCGNLAPISTDIKIIKAVAFINGQKCEDFYYPFYSDNGLTFERLATLEEAKEGNFYFQEGVGYHKLKSLEKLFLYYQHGKYVYKEVDTNPVIDKSISRIEFKEREYFSEASLDKKYSSIYSLTADNKKRKLLKGIGTHHVEFNPDDAAWQIADKKELPENKITIRELSKLDLPFPVYNAPLELFFKKPAKQQPKRKQDLLANEHPQSQPKKRK